MGRLTKLLVVGGLHASCDIDDIEALFRGIEQNRLVQVEDRPSDERLSELIQSVDVVFMPYLRGWNSGFAMLVLGCGGRLLCSDLPMFRELEDAVGAPWVYVFDHRATDLSGSSPRRLHVSDEMSRGHATKLVLSGSLKPIALNGRHHVISIFTAISWVAAGIRCRH